MTTAYTPELGQAVFGAPTGEYELPRYADALFTAIWRELGRVFWNREQRDFASRGEEDPKIPGFTVRAYRYDDAPESELPNFVFGDVEIRWYKWPGRGMSANVDWTPEQWVTWFDAAMTALHEYDLKRFNDSLPPQTFGKEGESPF